MSGSGYVYVLFNPSLVGLVKIGRTARDTSSRAAELSSATGVPTPFIVAYEAHFEDADAAERLIHATLTHKGFRRASNREFFEMALGEAVQAVVDAHKQLGTHSSPSIVDPDVNPEPDVFDELCDFADKLFSGEGDMIQDKDRALDLYRRSANAGSIRASLEVAEIWASDEIDIKPREIRRWLEMAAERGSLQAWGDLALLWRSAGHSMNSRKCWDRFFSRDLLEHSTSILWGTRYVRTTPVGDVTDDHRAALIGVRDALLRYHSKHSSFPKRIELALFPEISQPRVLGQVVDIQDGVAVISGSFTVNAQDLPAGVTLSVGQQIEFVADPFGRSALEVRRIEERVPPDWDLIERIRKRLAAGGLDPAERKALLQQARDEMNR